MTYCVLYLNIDRVGYPILHGDAAHVVLLIDPHQESLLLVVEDPSGIRPVSTCAAVRQDIVRSGFLEEEASILQLLLLLLGHGTEGIVLAGKIARHGGQGSHQQTLDSASLLAISCGRQGKSVNGTTGSDTGGHHILVEFGSLLRSHFQMRSIHIRSSQR